MDILINNAGAMWIPERKTVDGFESIFATNYLGTMKRISVTVTVIVNARDLIFQTSNVLILVMIMMMMMIMMTKQG